MARDASLTPAQTAPAPNEAPFAVPPRSPRPLGAGGASRARAAEPSGRHFGVVVAIIFFAYMALAIWLYVARGVHFITPDRWLVVLFFGALLFGQGLKFLRDWIPFVLLIFGYELLRSFAGDVVYNGKGFNRQHHGNVQVEALINGDKALFGGHLPTLWLQDRYYVPGKEHWYDYLAVAFYFLHFVTPLVFGFVLWLRHKERFWQFSLAFLFMTYVAFAFFLFYPAAPPWLANNWHYISGVQFPYGQTINAMMPAGNNNFDAMTIWSHKSPNPVAAMPSLHAGFPWLVTLFAVKFFRRWGLLFVLYNPALWFSVVYGGQHWVIDILAGMAWATVSFVAIQYAWPSMMRGFAIPVPRPLRLALAQVGATVGPPVDRVRHPVRGAKARLGGVLVSPFRRRERPETRPTPTSAVVAPTPLDGDD